MSLVTATIRSSGKTMDPSYQLLTLDIIKEANRIPHATLTLLDGDAAQRTFAISDATFFQPGNPIEIKLRYEGAGQDTIVFKGLVVKQMIESNEYGSLLTVELKDSAIKMTQTRSSEVYTKKADHEIFSALIRRHSLKLGTLDTTQPKHPEIVQYHSTDWDFLLSRSDLYGMLVIAEDGEVSVKKVATQGNPKHTIDFGISEVYRFEMEVDGSHQYATVETVAWDAKNQKLTQATSKASSFQLAPGNLKTEKVARAVGGKVQALSSVVPIAPQMLQAWANGAMIKNCLSMVRGSMTIPGNPKIKRMDLLKLNGIGKRFNGKTLVTGVRHRVDQHGWQTDVQFGLSAEQYISKSDIMDRPAAGHLPGVNGLQIGLVTDIQDPNKESRIKIMLPSIGDQKSEIWARMAVPDAGNKRGVLFRPEPGDEVVVGFFNDDPRQAVILGSLFGAKNAVPQALPIDQKNLKKGIVTHGGISLVFSDDDSPSVSLETPAANKIFLDDKGKAIQISDQHGNAITMDQNGITIKSAKDIKIEASGNVEIAGVKVDVK